MIFDKIENITNYSEIDKNVAEFILGLSSSQSCGKIYLSDDKLTFANVEEYITKTLENCKPEAHKKYVDIQLLLEGVEELDYTSASGLNVKEAYDLTRDIMFFEQPAVPMNRVILKPGNFILLYPHEAHQPQMAYKNLPSKVKKVVVKVPAFTF